jgi:hypothetical protein
MTTFDWTIVSGAFCGLFMVVGGIYLLYKGVIKLDQVSCEEAVALEFQKMLKLQTRYPALGLFIIGLTFILMSIFFSKPSGLKPITLQGQIDGADPSGVTMHVKSADWKTIEPDSDGKIDTVVYPDVQRVEIQVQAAGCKPESAHFTLAFEKSKGGVLSLPKMSFQKIAEKPPQGLVKPTPANLPPLETKETFN